MRFSLTTLFFALAGLAGDATAQQQCAAEGKQAKECGGKGQKPDNCCANLICSSNKKCVAPSTCPQTLVASCVLWAPTGGNGQAIHAMAAITDENGSPLNGVDVTMETTDPSGVTELFSSTTSKPWVNYEDDLVENCGESITKGVTSDKCYQQTEQGTYSAVVTGLTMDGCPNVSVDLGSQADYSVTVRRLVRG